MAIKFAVIGIILLICEMFIPGVVLLPIGVAFLLTAGAAYFIPSFELQLVILALLAPTCFLVFRRFFKKHSKPSVPTNFDGLVGKDGFVEEDIEAGSRGYARVYGDSWKIEGLRGEGLSKGTKVIVDHVEGTKIFVRKA